MASYSRKSHTNTFFLIPAFIVLIVLIISITPNIFLDNYKKIIEENLSQWSGQKVRIKKITYLPLANITLKGVTFCEYGLSDPAELLTIDKVRLALSLKKLFFQGKVSIKSIVVQNTKIDYHNLFNFFKHKKAEASLMESILSHKESFNFIAKRVRVVLPGDNGQEQQIVFNLSVNSSNSSMYGFGLLKLEGIRRKPVRALDFKKNGTPLQFKFKIQNKDQELNVDNLEFHKGAFSLKLWGKVQDSFLRLSGYSYVNTFFSSHFPPKKSFNIVEKIKRIILQRKDLVRSYSGKEPDLRIFDIDCRIHVSYPLLQIDDMTFSFNGVPYGLKGGVSFLDKVSLNLKLISYPYEDRRIVKPRKINLEAKGALLEKGFNGNIFFDFPVIKRRNKYFSHIEGEFENLNFSFRRINRPEVYFDKANITYFNELQYYGTEFKEFKALFDLEDTQTKLFIFKANVNDGFVKGDGEFDAVGIPMQYRVNIVVEGLDLEKSKLYLGYPFKAFGKLYGQMHYTEIPSQASGKITIKEGSFEDTEFLNWVSDYFSVPLLKKLNFKEVTAYFLFDDNGLMFKDIDLTSPEVAIKGDFYYYDNRLVLGKISLSLSREALATSSLSPLLRYLDKNTGFLTLDFQLSGLFTAMNFKWLESDFKNRLKAAIPDFAERGIEKQIESILEPQPPKPKKP